MRRSILFLAALGWACSSDKAFVPSFPDDTAPLFEGGVALQAAVPPPPLSGGTLFVTKAGYVAVSDPDNDAVYFVDPTRDARNAHLIATLPLEQGDEPGRIAEDDAGRVHVVLRRGGAIATFQGPLSDSTTDLGASGGPAFKMTARRTVCSAPRGIAYEPSSRAMLVTCASGELVTLPRTGEPHSVYIDRDLRDIAINNGTVYITRFRSAEILSVNLKGEVLHRSAPPSVAETQTTAGTQPGVAWRMLMQGSSIYVVHQQATTTKLGMLNPPNSSAAYYGPPSPDLMAAVFSVVGSAVVGTTSVVGTMTQTPVTRPLVIDMALSPGGTIATVSPNVRDGMTVAVLPAGYGGIYEDLYGGPSLGETTAIAFLDDYGLLVQTRSPARLVVFKRERGQYPLPPGSFLPVADVTLSPEKRKDTGHAIFHNVSSTRLACASCHPEGSDDAHVWNFRDFGIRRTQDIRGGVLSTAPFHWDGDMDSIAMLGREIFSVRMGGARLTSEQSGALAHWLNTIPAAPKRGGLDPASVARGEALFFGKAKCDTCHSGATLTNNTSADVGTGGSFQVPALIGVGDRAPFMHTGCAPTLLDRFTNPKCGGSNHTNADALNGATDLVAYLESL